MGTALNHLSRVTLLNSWPRNKASKKDAKHLERLKRVADTTFESYNAGNGGWIFTAPHFSSYSLAASFECHEKPWRVRLQRHLYLLVVPVCVSSVYLAGADFGEYLQLFLVMR
ncbi:hypothetical protein C7974DRAFT_38189 [Boeremia exigua]|uniref:uncharacterized protein n=1 Tax=Boeremia exigua TaxID=749465 RepID=UPI001E8E0383|nr:uncharacterized protein C7974DRAFT_38189 [Boeremia exigua]KAH6618850.1 hypothetical protein C7974DRAFT_38189 [Boeremia exigua]